MNPSEPEILPDSENGPKRVMVYVDGYNLFFGIRSKGWKKYYWLDLWALATVLLKPGQILAGIHYFTSRLCSDGSNNLDIQRQKPTWMLWKHCRGLKNTLGTTSKNADAV